MKRGARLVLVLLATLLGCSAASGVPDDRWIPEAPNTSGGVRGIGSDWQMMLDDTLIAYGDNVQRKMAEPQRHGPFMLGDSAHGQPYVFGSVLHVDGRYQMWYEVGVRGDAPRIYSTVLRYAESVDGTTWTWPSDLHLVPDQLNSTDALRFGTGNGLLVSGRVPCWCSVAVDESESDPSARYKMLFIDMRGTHLYGDGGVWAYQSPDGIHWQVLNDDKRVISVEQSSNSTTDINDLVARNGRIRAPYTMIGKAHEWIPNPKKPGKLTPTHKIVTKSQSPVFGAPWPTPRTILTHKQWKTPADPQSYGMPTFRYHGLAIGLLRRYEFFHPGGSSFVESRVAVSHDDPGLNRWTVVSAAAPDAPPSTSPSDWRDRQGILFRVGAPGSWDSGMVFVLAPVERPDRLEFFYSGFDAPHNVRVRNTGIGMLSLLHARFAYIERAAGPAAAVVVTVPVHATRPHLVVNADVPDDHGVSRIAVGVEDAETGKPLPGLAAEDCDGITAVNKVDHVVTWQGILPRGLRDRTLRIRFILHGDAKLYAFRMLQWASSVEHRRHDQQVYPA